MSEEQKPAAAGSATVRMGGWQQQQQGGVTRNVAEDSADSYSIADAARLVGVQERTFRNRIDAGEVPTRDPGPGQRGRRIPAAWVEANRKVPEELSYSFREEVDRLERLAERFRKEAAGARLAAKMHHDRHLAALREREGLLERIAFLEARLLESEESAEQFRILIGQHEQTVQSVLAETNQRLKALEQPLALPPAEEPQEDRRPAWKRWFGIG